MKEIDLGRIQSGEFENYLIIGFDKNWSKLNNEQPLEFEVKINKKNQLVLSATLAGERQN